MNIGSNVFCDGGGCAEIMLKLLSVICAFISER